MQHPLKTLVVEPERENNPAIAFCEQYLGGARPRYVFGCNAWGRSIAAQVEIDGFIDDVVQDRHCCGKRVLRSAEVPEKAIVVSAVVLGRPLTALTRIRDRGWTGLDYFAFQKYSLLTLADVLFLGGFEREFSANRGHYDWLFMRLKDSESRRTLTRIINFRLSRDLCFMEGFVDAQDRQYFEPFLELRSFGETFLDVGCFDGYTSMEFIKRCPGYQGIHVFEPEAANMETVKSRLENYPRIQFHPFGASERDQTLPFKAAGSASVVSEDGELSIAVKRIDDVIPGPYSFLKMDIEGGEMAALKGAARTITRYHPRLAISVYHKVGDLWRIPQQILEWRDDYDLYLRHYTEGVTETVMFFVPKSDSL